MSLRDAGLLVCVRFGMMDDSEYAEKAIQKMAFYEQNNIYIGDKLIVTFETQNHPLNSKQIVELVQHYFTC